MLFELLARSPDVWTVGGESHVIVESIEPLHPVSREYHSNRLTAQDATPQVAAQLQDAFCRHLRNRHGNTLPNFESSIRLLEKTPKNALRIPFLSAIFPDARFIYLHREPGPNISSILEAWRSSQFITYPDLPGWLGNKWSLLLIPDWKELIGKPLIEIAVRQWLVANEQILEDLARLPQDRWCAVSYEETLSAPQAVAQKLSDFACWGWDQQIEGNLPDSRNTLTPPDAEKWKANEEEITPFLSLIEPVAAQARQVLGSSAPVLTTHISHLSATPDPMTTQQQEKVELNFSSEHTSNFPALLQTLKISLAVSTYQAGKLIFVRERGGVLNTHFRDFISPMGIAYEEGMLAVGTKHEVWKLRNFHQLGSKIEPNIQHDAVFLPAAVHVTGDIRIHEIAWGKNGELWAVNTRFSCLCTFDGYHNFVPRWRPPFISALAAEDRCHLNGMAMREGSPAYVSCHAPTDTPEGWRGHKVDGGCITDVQSGKILVSGLSMPHSPRLYEGKLWFLESGHGRLSTLDLKSAQVKTIAELPGFPRGLDFIGQFAFIGLSQVRETAVFSGVPISEPARERNCGVWVLDIITGKTVAFLRFSGIVQEIFAVQVLPFVSPDLIIDNPELIGGAFFVPPEALEG